MHPQMEAFCLNHAQNPRFGNCTKEFNTGDVGLAGGIQVSEPANANLVTEDSDWDFGRTSTGL